MTRINGQIPVAYLSDEHLRAEYYELPRICSLYRQRALKNHKFDDIPKSFSLGSGHVKFFYDKGQFLVDRWQSISHELRQRGFDIDTAETFKKFGVFRHEHMNSWYVNGLVRKIVDDEIRDRIADKVLHVNKTTVWHYYRQPITPQECISLMYEDQIILRETLRQNYLSKII